MASSFLCVLSCCQLFATICIFSFNMKSIMRHSFFAFLLCKMIRIKYSIKLPGFFWQRSAYVDTFASKNRGESNIKY